MRSLYEATLVSIAEAPVPAGGVVARLEAADGTRFRVARWTPEGARRGSVVVMNGRTEYIEKYFETIGELLGRGFAVATLDWRGQGGSDRPLPNRQKGHVRDFALYTSDLHQMLESFAKPHCPGPYIALAHSMGGNVALRYLRDRPGTFERAVLSAPMLGIGSGRAARALLRAASVVGNALRLGRHYPPGLRDFGPRQRAFEGNPLTSDPQRFARMIAQLDADPGLAVGGPTFGWMRAAYASMDAIRAPGFARAVETPVLIASAGADAVVSNEAQARVVAELPHGVRVAIEGARHELLMEAHRYRAQFLRAFDEFTA